MSKIIKNYIAETAIGHRALVKSGTADGKVVVATAATDDIIGVADAPGGAAVNARLDIVLLGEAEVISGGAIPRFGYITAGAAGAAVAAAPAASVNNGVGGRVFVSAVSGDFVKAFINPTRIQG
jgi:hypothetical protein